MNAVEARQITNNSIKYDVLGPLLEIAYDRIKEFAEKGKSSVPHPFYGSDIYDCNIINMGIDQLKMDGFTTKFHDVIDSSDPREHSYWEISW